jgi:hypothetical protein
MLKSLIFFFEKLKKKKKKTHTHTQRYFGNFDKI